ncbi:shugoshin-1-like isoform X1 [Phoenix dactylifera]|uniref:Shugoshin-1-like isoform X1 n=2 Tax=Phoenix dactylifera TaxID=42345 RepID=A0A8B7D431_PHODC|nr:shugoshin-1-like isoform X1 [Phoenix dactylifera]
MTSLITRKRLSDITNLTSIRRSPRSKAEDQEMVKAVPTVSAKNYISQLLTENSALSKIIEEKNKIIDMNGIELRKLRFMLQKAHQQNAQFAHTNSQMLAEFNLGKDRLKAMQHELGCMTAALRTKTLELEEVKKLYKQHKQPYKNINIVFKENKNKLAEFVPDASHLASYQKACSPNGKRKLRSRSLGTTTLPQQVAAKEKNECRNSRSLRRRSSNLNAEHCEPTEGLFEIEDIKFPIRSLTSDPMHEDNSAQLEPSSAQPKSDAIMNPVKVELQEEKSSSKDHQGSRRSSLGRPMRRAAEKVNSYKEVPLNVKMRRNE